MRILWKKEKHERTTKQTIGFVVTIAVLSLFGSFVFVGIVHPLDSSEANKMFLGVAVIAFVVILCFTGVLNSDKD